MIPQLHDKRHHLRHHTVSAFYRGHILLEYYLLRRKTFTALRGRFIR